MDDLHFRRSIYADPKSQDANLLAAQKEDATKKKFAQEILALDEKIYRTLKVPVPEDLCDKLIFRQTLAYHHQEKRKKRIHFALAASVAIIAGLLVNFISFSSAYSDLGEHALAHVYHEQENFTNTSNDRVSLASLNKKMSSFNGKFKGPLGTLVFADYCHFDTLSSLHLVFQGKTSPVTVFVVPKNDQLAFSDKFNDSALFGGSLAFDKANIVVIADKNESIDKWKKAISDKVTWSI